MTPGVNFLFQLLHRTQRHMHWQMTLSTGVQVLQRSLRLPTGGALHERQPQRQTCPLRAVRIGPAGLTLRLRVGGHGASSWVPPWIPTSMMQAAHDGPGSEPVTSTQSTSKSTARPMDSSGKHFRLNLHGPPALWFNRADDEPLPELQAAHRGSDPHLTTRPMPDTRLSSGEPHGTKATWPLVPCELCGSTVGSRSRQRA